MKLHLTRAVAGAIGAAAAVLTWTSHSFAQTTHETEVVTTPAPVAASAEVETYTGPNRALIGTGLITFGLSYIPAVVVAGTSSQSADHHLYVPVVGPWLDIGDRPDCGARSISCDTETTNKVLIAADGVFQGIGVLATVAGLLTPERTVTTTTAANKVEKQPQVRVSPTRFGSTGYGVAAFGQF
jgi:hypothetical protein